MKCQAYFLGTIRQIFNQSSAGRFTQHAKRYDTRIAIYKAVSAKMVLSYAVITQLI